MHQFHVAEADCLDGGDPRRVTRQTVVHVGQRKNVISGCAVNPT